MKRVKVVSDGTVHGTSVFNEDGQRIPGITRIEFDPIDAKNPFLISIRITLVNVELLLDADIEIIDAIKGVQRKESRA